MTGAGWTRDKPQSEGFYWFRGAEDLAPWVTSVQHVEWDNRLWYVCAGGYLPVDEVDHDVRWLGPIFPDTYHQGCVAGLKYAAIICRERGKPHDIEWWNTASKKEISRQTAMDCAELIEQQAQRGEK